MTERAPLTPEVIASPLRRYYNDVHYASSYPDLLIAAGLLCETVVHTDGLDRMLPNQDLLPTWSDHDESERLTKEQFKLFPLLKLGSWVEATNSPEKALFSWASVSANYIRTRTSKTHTRDCLQELDFADASCQASPACPLRMTEQHLTSLVFYHLVGPERKRLLDVVAYQVEPAQARKVALIRLDAALETGFVTPQAAAHLRSKYETWYEQSFPSLPAEASPHKD